MPSIKGACLGGLPLSGVVELSEVLALLRNWENLGKVGYQGIGFR